MKDLKLYTWRTCPFSKKALKMLEENGYEFENVDILDHPEIKEKLTQETGQTSVPYVFIGEDLIGGSSDLEELMNQGKLDKLLED